MPDGIVCLYHTILLRYYMYCEACIKDMCVCKAIILFSLHFQAEEVLLAGRCHRTPACQENDLVLILTRTWNLYYLFYLHISRFFGHTQDDFSLTTDAHVDTDANAGISVKCAL
uniref:Uncharacterized protein n=1 Tax=Rhipicephalus microplus TaxID=6941 RepID=A0A6G5AIY6_RHIMP